MAAEIDRLTEQWDLVAPVPPNSLARRRPVAAPLTRLSGARGAFVENSKENALLLLQEIGRLMREEFSLADATFLSKPLHTRVAPERVIEEAARNDFALVAIGD